MSIDTKKRITLRKLPISEQDESANGKIAYRIKHGQLERASHCEVCEREIYTAAHHNDYRKPLEVTWLCHSCHQKLHKANVIEIDKTIYIEIMKEAHRRGLTVNKWVNWLIDQALKHHVKKVKAPDSQGD